MFPGPGLSPGATPMMVNPALWIHSPLHYHLSQKVQGCLDMGVYNNGQLDPQLGDGGR